MKGAAVCYTLAVSAGALLGVFQWCAAVRQALSTAMGGAFWSEGELYHDLIYSVSIAFNVIAISKPNISSSVKLIGQTFETHTLPISFFGTSGTVKLPYSLNPSIPV